MRRLAISRRLAPPHAGVVLAQAADVLEALARDPRLSLVFGERVRAVDGLRRTTPQTSNSTMARPTNDPRPRICSTPTTVIVTATRSTLLMVHVTENVGRSDAPPENHLGRRNDTEPDRPMADRAVEHLARHTESASAFVLYT